MRPLENVINNSGKKYLFLIQIESYSLMVFCNIEINDDNYSSEPKAEEVARLVFGPF